MRISWDYTDYADYAVGSDDTAVSADGCALSDKLDALELVPAKNDAPLGCVPATDAGLHPEDAVRQPYYGQEHAVISVINRNHCNQSELPARSQPAQTSTDYVDYSDASANGRATSDPTEMYETVPPMAEASRESLPITGTVPPIVHEFQEQNNHRNGAVISVINRNQCNQSELPAQQDTSHISIDYADYSDASADGRAISDSPDRDEPVPPMEEAFRESLPATGTHPSVVDAFQQGTHHRNGAVITVINHHQRNQPELSPQPESAPGRDSQNGVPSDDETPKKELGATPVVNTAGCPHHPHARWVRFDPSGQAWCDKMDCWDCYRLMKIGEVLVYPHLQGSTHSTTIDQGKAAWASFVFSQGSFVVMAATEQAIAMCKKLGVAVPDLSGEVQQLVPMRE